MNNAKKQLMKLSVIKVFLWGAATFFVGLVLDGGFFNPSTLSSVCNIISMGFVSLAGLIIILRKELPRPALPAIKGFGAVISGVFIFMTALFMGFLSIIDLIHHLQNQ